MVNQNYILTGLIELFAMGIVVPFLIFCVMRILYSLLFGLGRVIGKTQSNEKAFKVWRLIAIIALHFPVFVYPFFFLVLYFLGWPPRGWPELPLPGWLGEPYSAPFLIVGSISAVFAGKYSPHKYNFWTCLYHLL